MSSTHIVRYSFKQAHFDQPTVGHFAVVARDAQSAVNVVANAYRNHAVNVEYVAPVNGH